MESKVVRVNGALKISIDGEIFEPLSFKSFRPAESNITDFKNAGVRLFSILTAAIKCYYGIPYSLFGESWLGIGKYDFDAIDRQIDLFIKSAPDGYFAPMIMLDTRDWWLESHENFPYSFQRISQAAYDEEWRCAAGDYLEAMLTHIEEKYGERVYGYFMLCGHTTEWLSDYDFQESHPIKERYYRDYTGDPNAKIPEKNRLELPSNVSFYSDDEVKLYQKAHAELISDTILYFAARAQKILKHKKLFGLYYGYLLELMDERLWNAGHLDFQRVFESPDIDMISSPASYEYRAIDSTSAFMLAQKSLDLHNKIYYYEFDQRTYLSQTSFEGVTIPPAGYTCRNDREAVDLMHRDFMLCEANGAALWWFDMWRGWYSSPKMLSSINQMINIAGELSKYSSESISEVAVIVSGKSMYGVNKCSGINNELLGLQRDGLMRLGAPFDYYSIEDVSLIDVNKYKLFVFANDFSLSDKDREVIEKIKKSGNKTILWCYAPGYNEGGASAVSGITGIKLGEYSEAPTLIENCGSILPAPYFFADEGEPLVRFSDGRTAIARKNNDTFTSVYSAIGNLTGKVLREIARDAGVHIFCDTAPVYINKTVIGVYNTDECEVNLLRDGELVDLFSGEKYVSKNCIITLPKSEFASKLLIYT